MVVSDQFVLCEAALVFAITRWLLSFALNFFTNTNSTYLDDSVSSCCTPSTSSSPNLKILKDSLSLTTLGEIEGRLGGPHDSSCTVCLDKLKKKSQVYELGNCSHVFHKVCLEKWLCYDNKLTCPLCRASLVAAAPLPPVLAVEQPSWAVERMLYLFGDDLLP